MIVREKKAGEWRLGTRLNVPMPYTLGTGFSVDPSARSLVQVVVTYASLVEAFESRIKWTQVIKVVLRRRSRDQDEIQATKINGSTISLRY